MSQPAAKGPLIGFGSSAGNAMRHARVLSGFTNSDCVELNELTIEDLKKKGTVIFVCSTIGEGDFPDNAVEFAESLEKSTEDLSCLQFAVCGFGNSRFEDFCQAGKNLQKYLLSRGAKPIMDLQLVDVSRPDKGESLFDMWCEKLCSSLGLPAPKIEVKVIFKVTRVDDKSVVDTPLKPKGYEYSEMVSNTRWTPEGYEPMMSYLEFKVPEGMTYDSGNHCSIIPRNDGEIVSRVIRALSLNGDDVYSIEPQGRIQTLIPAKVSVSELFSQYLDLNGLPERSILRCFHSVSNSEGQRLIEECLSGKDDDRAFKSLIAQYNTGEFIVEFSKYGVPSLEHVVSSCPQIQPRLYSISSSPLVDKSKFTLVVGNVLFGDHRHGLCTHYLNFMSPKSVLAKLQRGVFTYPKDIGTPIILACLGTGIAPMLSLLEHRKCIRNEGTLGKCIIYFGARYKKCYQEIETRLSAYKQEGIVDEYRIAYSRDQEQKIYITDLMREDLSSLWSYWSDDRSQFFYCGPPRDIPDTLQKIMDDVVSQGKNISVAEAKKLNKKRRFWIESY